MVKVYENKLLQLKIYLRSASKHEIESVITECNQQLRDRFNKSRRLKRGNLSPYLTKSKFHELLEATLHEKYRFIFTIMRKLALRVGEVPGLRMHDLDLEHKQLFVRTEKSQMPDICYLDAEAVRMFRAWIDKYKSLIDQHHGHLFFPDPQSHSSRDHIHPQKIAKHFRTACSRAGVQVVYGSAENSHKTLNLFSTHSLRHSGITDFYIKTHDVVLTKKFARHQSLSSTLGYIHHTEKDMREAIEDSGVRADPEEFKEFLKVYQAFQEAQKEEKNGAKSPH